MKRRVQRWGNSLAVRIPAALAEACALHEGTTVEIREDEGRLMLVPEVRERPRYRLEHLVRRITPRNRHRAVKWGGARGREAW